MRAAGPYELEEFGRLANRTQLLYGLHPLYNVPLSRRVVLEWRSFREVCHGMMAGRRPLVVSGLPSPPVSLEFRSWTQVRNGRGVAPAKVVFGFISIVCVDCIRDPTSINYWVDHIQLGLACPDVRTDLNWELNGKWSNGLQ